MYEKPYKPVKSAIEPRMGNSNQQKESAICLLVGPLPETDRGNQWILVAVDHFTQ